MTLGKSALFVTAIFVTAGSAVAQDAVKGATTFKQRCAACHMMEAGKKGGMGPNLAGVSGRPAGRLPGYSYSPAMQKANVTWSKGALDKYLAGPGKMIPGTRMPIALTSEAQRADVIAYLLGVKAK